MKKIGLIYMGGTFGCIGDPLSPMPAEAFIPQLKKVLPLHLNIECFIAPVIKDSSACTAKDWLKLVQYLQVLQRDGFQHFVIIHGTDTLSYASAVLAQFMAKSAHVILTGSQYPLLTVTGGDTREFTDALENLNFALNAINQCSAGVYLAFHYQLIHAQTALKIHTTDLNAFHGISVSQDIQQASNAFLIENIHIEKAAQFNCVNWMMQPIEQYLLSLNLKNILEAPPHCLILQGFGIGNLAINSEILSIIHSLQAKNCAVILTTQVPFGEIDQRYAISDWVQTAKILVSNTKSHADLYAKTLKMYLKYDAIDQWHTHWGSDF